MHPDELDRRLRALHDELDATPNDLDALDRLEGRIRLGDFDGVVPQGLMNELARRRVAIKRAQRKELSMSNIQAAQDKLDELWAEYDVLYNLYDMLGGGMYHALGGRYVNVPALEHMIGKTSNEIGELTFYLAEAAEGKRVTPGKLSPKQDELLGILKRGGFVLCDRIGDSQRSLVRVINEYGNEVKKFPFITVAALYRRDLIKDVAKFGDYLTTKKFVYRDRDAELQETLDRIKSRR